MNIVDQFIAYGSYLIWIAPTIRQYRTDWFLFFLCLTIIGPVSHLLYFNLNLPIYPVTTATIICLAQYFVLLRIPNITSKKINNIIFAVIAISLLIIFPQAPNYSLIFIDTLILGKVISYTIKKFFTDEEINIFLFFLVFFLVTVELNDIIGSIQSIDNTKLYYATTFVQYFVAIFFTIFKSDSPHLRIRLRSVKEKLGDEFNSPNV